VSAAIEISDLAKHFGRVKAVDGLALRVPEGAMFGLIGPNGAGKTTTFALLAGFLRPTRGTITVRGEALHPGLPPVGKIAVLPQDAAMPGRMRAIDALEMLGRLGGLSAGEARRRGDEAMARLALSPEQRRQRIGELSHGQRRRVGIAQTLLGEREIIILDEPTAGLDPRAAAELRATIRELRGQRTIVLSSHNLAEVESLCDHAAILSRGRVVSMGTMAELRRASALVRVVLGAPLADADAAVAELAAVAGVRTAALAPGAEIAVDLELVDEGDGGTDPITTQVLARLIGRGALIREVARGKSLEQRFLEETA
jgi:ABC-2 type transport system ATP-binding protein